MHYRTNPKNGDELSLLGFGCMRFHKDENEVERHILRAMELGVNYFDTAYIYPGSEATLGRILARNGCRAQVKIATKLPPYLVRRREDFDKLLATQLERLQTHYIDYYFIHMLTSPVEWQRLVDLGVLDWVAEQRRAGVIRNLGFSFHGGRQNFTAIVDAHDWDFTMIQYNYIDEHNQAGRSGLDYAAAKGMPVMIMEPLRGGRLANSLPGEALQVFEAAVPGRAPAEWGFRFVWDHPGVTTVLSGMGTMAMVEENTRSADRFEPLTEAERTAYEQVRSIYLSKTPIPCTGCGYCVPCPFGVDIPLCFSTYNDRELVGKRSALTYYALRVGKKRASNCTRCGKCEGHCPQSIAIRDELENVRRAFEKPVYRPLLFAVNKFMRR